MTRATPTFFLPWIVLQFGITSLTLGQNQPPATPVISEPQPGRIINPQDLHMETEPFSDVNPGDTHVCTDWEVWTTSGGGTLLERVWSTLCIGGVERLHTHFGDGVFEGSLAGQTSLAPDTTYVFRARHRDSSGVPATEWSSWAQRSFLTGAAAAIFPMELEDALTSPVPTLRDSTGQSIGLPGGPSPARILIESFGNGTILDFTGPANGFGLVLNNPAPLVEHGPLRATITASATTLNIPATDVRFNDDDGRVQVIYLPEITVAPNQSVSFWISESGASFAATTGETTPNFSALRRGAPVPWSTRPGYRVEVVATGFQLPVNIAFVPEPLSDPNAPLYYVAELYGTIKVVRNNRIISDYATNLLNFNPTGNFPGSGEQGLAGICVDPTNGDLYATLVVSSIPGVESAPHYPRVVRFTSNDGGLTAATQTTIRDMPGETMGQSHQISNVTLGADGLLYVHVGDGFDAARAQDLTSYRGKIIRMTKTGAAIPANPFYNGAPITARDYVFVRGVRNPFGGAWRLSDNAHYFVENGPSVDRFAQMVAGRNYLWDGSDQSMTTFALYSWNPATAPVNIAFIQTNVFGGSGFPADRNDFAYVTQSGGTWASGPQTNAKCITEWEIDSTGALVAGPSIITRYNGTGKATAVAIAAGPDGLYFSDFYRDDDFQNPIARGSNILRLRYVGELDCNNNGEPDAQDIALGVSLDCNQNGIPDECDIGSGRSADCNNNGALDECDASTSVVVSFDAGLAPFVANGAAQLIDGRVRLTSSAGAQLGSIVRTPLDASPVSGFNVSFDFQIGGGTGADGMSFMALDSAFYTTSTLFGEEGPGPINQGPFALNALGVQFDTYDNFYGGQSEGNNTIEVIFDGQTVGRYTPTFQLADGVQRRAFVVVRDGAISVRISSAGMIETAFEQLPVPGLTPFIPMYAFGGRTGGLTNEHWVDNIAFSVPSPNDLNGNGIPDECELVCDSIDFNNDSSFFDPTDIDAFLSVFSEGPCIPTEAPCNDIDFNNDGALFDPCDIDSFLLVFSEGPCTVCGE